MSKIIQGDCLEQLKLLGDNSVDCVITSPPYNLDGLRKGVKLGGSMSWNAANIAYDTYQDNLPEQAYQNWQIAILNELHRIIKPTGSIFYNHKMRMWKRKGYHPYQFIGKSKVQFYQEIVWDRGRTPALDKRILFPFTERLYWLVKDKPNVYKDKVQQTRDIWRINPDKDNDHPAPFPLEIPDQLIKLTTQPGNLVLDPFAGSGTTLVAAKQLGRDYIGIEISEKYCDLIKERLNGN